MQHVQFQTALPARLPQGGKQRRHSRQATTLCLAQHSANNEKDVVSDLANKGRMTSHKSHGEGEHKRWKKGIFEEL
jgi:hypothetical protein